MIDQELQTEIENYLIKYREFTPLEIAEQLGVEIEYTKLDDPNFAGAIRKVDGKATIYVNRDDSTNRQIFTIAHELGHLFLHNDKIEQGIISYRHAELYAGYSAEQKKEEENANHFAAEMLMPKKIFTEFYIRNSDLEKDKLVTKMANLFGVSENSIKIRISYLDL